MNKNLKASYKKYILNFKTPSGTSRGILTTKETWFILLEHEQKTGIGECGILRTLSVDDVPDYEEKLKWTCNNIHLGLEFLLNELIEFPSIQFGLEQAFLSLNSSNKYNLFPSDFSSGKAYIPINGLIWMGNKSFIQKQIKEKIKAGFNCIKMKIGAIDFKTELDVLSSIRKEFTEQDIQLRVDANGAFKPENALEKLNYLSDFRLHSIEQPIKPKQFAEMANLCQNSPLAIALDEELIGVFNPTKKKEILDIIKPQFIILKPSLIGGINGSNEWISIAKERNIDFWITSALESNIGLNAIAQYTYTLNLKSHQGLGTGSLFTNNINSPLEVKKGELHYNIDLNWEELY